MLHTLAYMGCGTAVAGPMPPPVLPGRPILRGDAVNGLEGEAYSFAPFQNDDPGDGTSLTLLSVSVEAGSASISGGLITGVLPQGVGSFGGTYRGRNGSGLEAVGLIVFTVTSRDTDPDPPPPRPIGYPAATRVFRSGLTWPSGASQGDLKKFADWRGRKLDAVTGFTLNRNSGHIGWRDSKSSYDFMDDFASYAGGAFLNGGFDGAIICLSFPPFAEQIWSPGHNGWKVWQELGAGTSDNAKTLLAHWQKAATSIKNKLYGKAATIVVRPAWECTQKHYGHRITDIPFASRAAWKDSYARLADIMHETVPGILMMFNPNTGHSLSGGVLEDWLPYDDDFEVLGPDYYCNGAGVVKTDDDWKKSLTADSSTRTGFDTYGALCRKHKKWFGLPGMGGSTPATAAIPTARPSSTAFSVGSRGTPTSSSSNVTSTTGPEGSSVLYPVGDNPTGSAAYKKLMA